MYEEILFFINITSFYYTIIKVISKNIDSIFKLFHSFYRGPGVVTEKKGFVTKTVRKIIICDCRLLVGIFAGRRQGQGHTLCIRNVAEYLNVPMIYDVRCLSTIINRKN